MNAAVVRVALALTLNKPIPALIKQLLSRYTDDFPAETVGRAKPSCAYKSCHLNAGQGQKGE